MPAPHRETWREISFTPSAPLRENTLMKKTLYSVCKALAFVRTTIWATVLTMALTTVARSQDIPIDAEHFPDTAFRSHVKTHFDLNKDLVLSEAECNAVLKIGAPANDIGTEAKPLSPTITSLKGIEHFKNLTHLYASLLELSALDLSRNTALTTLYCDQNGLKSLDVSSCTNLSSLYCYTNQLSALDLSRNTALITLNCYNNHLKSLDLRQNTALTFLNCTQNQLSDLNVSRNTALITLECSQNSLKSLDVSSCKNLTTLRCSDNNLRRLNVGGCTKLTVIECSRNHLSLSSLYTFVQQIGLARLQTDTVSLKALENFDLNEKGEMQIGGQKTQWSLLPADPKNFSEKEGVFQFFKKGLYRLSLTNESVKDQNGVITFEWNIDVKSSVYTITLNSNNRTWGSVRGGGAHEENSLTDIHAEPKSGYCFVKWVHTDNPARVFGTKRDTVFRASEDLDLTAHFDLLRTYTISVVSDNPAWGSVSGGGTYNNDNKAEVRLTATPTNGYRFVKWVHAANPNRVFGTKRDTTFRASENLSLKACFEKIVYEVTVQSNRAEWGEATISGEGRYAENEEITIRAQAKEGYHFVKWVYTGSNLVFVKIKDYTFKVSGRLALTAEFEKIPENAVRVQVQPNSGFMGETFITGDGIYAPGTEVTISAKPKVGYRFSSWRKDREEFALNEDITFTVTENIQLTAYFRNVPPHNITVRAFPADWGEVSGGGTNIQENAMVSIGAVPKAGYRFVNWTYVAYNGNGPVEEVLGTAPDTTFMATQHLDLTAHFEMPPAHIITVQSNDTAMGEVSGGGAYKTDSVVVITATPKAGCRFIEWKNGEESFSYEPSVTFPAAESLTLTAYFAQAPLYRIMVSANPQTGGEVSGGGLYKENADVTISAIPKSGYRFVRWVHADAPERVFGTKADTTFKAVQNMELRAEFEPSALYTLVLRANNPAWGKALLSTGGDTAHCVQDEELTIVATPAEGCRFVRWINAASNEVFAFAATYTFKATESFVLTACFEEGSGKEEVPVYVRNKVIYLPAPMGKVQIFDLLGHLLYESSGTAFPVGAKGTYILRVKGLNVKVLVP